VLVEPVDADECTGDATERVGIVVGLDHFECIERGIAGEEPDELGETQIVAPDLGVGLEGCSGHWFPLLSGKAGGDSR
jgi:hypothetical protein